MTIDAEMAQPWIYLNGYPGVGKLSIARELKQLVPGSKIIDNHLIIDLCRNVFERASEEYESLRKAVRQELLTAIASTEIGRRTTYVFTGAHVKENPISPPIARAHENQAKAAHIPFVSVILTCQEEEHLRRATSPSRFGRDGAPGKLTDVDALKRMRSTKELFRFRCEHELELDVTELTALEAAMRIKQFVESAII